MAHWTTSLRTNLNGSQSTELLLRLNAFLFGLHVRADTLCLACTEQKENLPCTHDDMDSTIITIWCLVESNMPIKKGYKKKRWAQITSLLN